MKLSSLLALGLLTGPAFAVPVEIAKESFEVVPGIGFAVTNGFDSGTNADYCAAIPNNGTRILDGRVIASGDGSRMFGAEDIDSTAPTAQGMVTLNGVNIAGKINTSVKILLAAPGRSAVDRDEYDYNPANVAVTDYVRVEASLDGSPFQVLAQYAPEVTGGTAGTNSYLSRDTDLNGAGDNTADTLGQSFRELDLSIPTGNSVVVRVVFYTNATAEYILFDNIRVFGETAATNPPSIGGVSAGALSFTEGEAAKAIAPALTVTDTDSATLSSASVTISQNYRAAEDLLAATPSGAISAGDIVIAGGAVTINKVASLADYQAVLRSVTYRNSNLTSPDPAERQVTIVANDGTNPSNAVIRAIQINDIVPVQSVPYTESFETDGRGTRYAVAGGFQNGSSIFARLATPAPVTVADGSFVFVVEDTDFDPAPLEAVTVELNTQGYTNLKAQLLAGTVGTDFEQLNDLLTVEAQVDGGAWTSVGQFRATGSVNSPMALDVDLNGSGDTPQLGSALQNFSFNLPTATTLGVRVVAVTSSAGERIIFDNLRITGDLVTFAVAAGSALENSGSVTIPVTRTGGTSGAASLSYTLAGVTATAGTDFTATGGTVNFVDGQAVANIVVPITGDSVVELSETFTATISNPSIGQITTAAATGTITNDDSAVISLAGSTVAEGDSSTVNLPFTVSLTNAVDTDITVDRQTLATGSATAGTDFTALATAGFTIPAGQTSVNFNVAASGDNDVESDETVDASLTNLAASGRSVSLGTVTATGTITDDDPLLVAGNGALAVKIGASGKLKIADLLALTTIVEGRPVSLVSVQNLPTAQGGTVTIVDGWIYYQPPAGYSGPDSFTFTITDGVQTVTGTVSITASAETGATVNIFKLVDEADDKRVLTLGIPGRGYRLQFSGDLTAWTNSGSPIVCPASGTMSFLDEGPLPPTRFYRVIEVTP